MLNAEERYIKKRVIIAEIQSILFYFFRILPINRKKIVFCCIEGTTGYSCNPKYIAEEFIRRNAKGETDYELVWLVNDIAKKFPDEIQVVRNTLWNRAFQLTTAAVWIDNSRKQLEVRKRKGQLYIQTWHAKLGFKPTCLDRGASFSKIAYFVSKHDSDMIDYVLSNSKWYDDTLSTGMLYNGPTLRTGSPRCDILINRTETDRKRVRVKYQIPEDAQIIMYAPTFRGGSQGKDRMIQANNNELDYDIITQSLEKRFGGKWYVFLRLHPQLVARSMGKSYNEGRVIDVSQEDDMYEILAGCDAFMTDYSSAAFDASLMRIPVLLYCDDYQDYQKERGSLLWDLEKLPFPMATNPDNMKKIILEFDNTVYPKSLKHFLKSAEVEEDGCSSKKTVDIITEEMYEIHQKSSY